MSNREDFTDTALGLVSAQSFPAIVGIADHMLKSSGVTLVGYEKIGSGHCTAIVRGSVADVRLAVQEGAERAQQFGQKLSTLVVPRPMPNLEVVLPIGNRLAQLATGRGHSKLSNQAVGLLETRGFPAMVGAADAMMKSADVVLAAYETIGAGLCTAIVRGSVANVAMALDAGMIEAERIGELHAVMLVPRPLEDLDQTLPLASCWIEEVQPLRIPLTVKETEKELVALPELMQEAQPLATPLEQKRLEPIQTAPEFNPIAAEPREVELKEVEVLQDIAAPASLLKLEADAPTLDISATSDAEDANSAQSGLRETLPTGTAKVRPKHHRHRFRHK
ncbi:carbon dioxide-concentrating mechanism protein CcmK [Leptolyngbyaceae cyanobacterium UHCC 1019]